jgi:hypothetical protein
MTSLVLAFCNCLLKAPEKYWYFRAAWIYDYPVIRIYFVLLVLRSKENTPVINWVWLTLMLPLTLREEHRMRLLQKTVLRRYLGLRGTGEDYIMRSFTICTPHQILF